MMEGRNPTPNERRYSKLDDLWPQVVPPLTDQEAVSAAKRLYRLGCGRAFGGTFKIVTGNRRTWVRANVFTVNTSKGWKSLVHTISHLTHWTLHPDRPGHHWSHLGFERKLTEAVINNGWLDGKLRREPKPKPDQQTVRYQRIIVRIESWEKKRQRAENALIKLRRSKAYYDKKITD